MNFFKRTHLPSGDKKYICNDDLFFSQHHPCIDHQESHNDTLSEDNSFGRLREKITKDGISVEGKSLVFTNIEKIGITTMSTEKDVQDGSVTDIQTTCNSISMGGLQNEKRSMKFDSLKNVALKTNEERRNALSEDQIVVSIRELEEKILIDNMKSWGII